MYHPALHAFEDAYADRFPDLKITLSAGVLVCEYEDVDGCGYTVHGVMLGNDVDPSFEWRDVTPVRDADHLAALVKAFSVAVSDIEDEGIGNAPAAPGTFGALVWTRAIDDRLAVIEQTADDLRTERERLNPKTADDLDSFWREQTPEERAAISAAYVKAYGDRPYGDQSHAFAEEEEP